MSHTSPYPTSGLLVLGSQHLRKGRLYKIRIASVNAQSNLVHGESVWLESETRLIEYAFRCQVADCKKKSWISFFVSRREDKKVRIKPGSFRPSLLTFVSSSTFSSAFVFTFADTRFKILDYFFFFFKRKHCYTNIYIYSIYLIFAERSSRIRLI